MPNELTEIQDEVARLNQARRAEKAGAMTEQPQTLPTPGLSPVDGSGFPPTVEAVAPAPPAPPEPVGPPRLLGVDFSAHSLFTSIGNFALTELEAKLLAEICMKTLARAFRETFALVASAHNIPVPKRPGLTVMEPRPSTTEDEETT
jgi:hypothetical protein